MRAFISHSHTDNDFCRLLAKYLRDAQVEVWYDEYDLREGELDTKLTQEIETTDAFIVVLSANSIQSAWVEKECQIAAKRYMQSQQSQATPYILLPVALEAIPEASIWPSVANYKRVQAETPGADRVALVFLALAALGVGGASVGSSFSSSSMLYNLRERFAPELDHPEFQLLKPEVRVGEKFVVWVSIRVVKALTVSDLRLTLHSTETAPSSFTVNNAGAVISTLLGAFVVKGPAQAGMFRPIRSEPIKKQLPVDQRTYPPRMYSPGDTIRIEQEFEIPQGAMHTFSHGSVSLQWGVTVTVGNTSASTSIIVLPEKVSR